MKLEMPNLWQPVLDYWFDDALDSDWPTRSRNGLWFRADERIDADIRERFGAMVEAALQNEWVDWEAKPLGRLALVLLLDQFTRNMYRASAEAFSGDHRAITLVMEGIARRMDRELPTIGRVFFYMPLMHAEDEDLQAEAVRQFERLHEAASGDAKAGVASNLEFAREHQQVIQRFGRFPHRNAVLGRDSTAEELAYLEDANRYGQ